MAMSEPLLHRVDTQCVCVQEQCTLYQVTIVAGTQCSKCHTQREVSVVV